MNPHHHPRTQDQKTQEGMRLRHHPIINPTNGKKQYPYCPSSTGDYICEDEDKICTNQISCDSCSNKVCEYWNYTPSYVCNPPIKCKENCEVMKCDETTKQASCEKDPGGTCFKVTNKFGTSATIEWEVLDGDGNRFKDQHNKSQPVGKSRYYLIPDDGSFKAHCNILRGKSKTVSADDIKNICGYDASSKTCGKTVNTKCKTNILKARTDVCIDEKCT
jgi:hypothetical protein